MSLPAALIWLILDAKRQAGLCACYHCLIKSAATPAARLPPFYQPFSAPPLVPGPFTAAAASPSWVGMILADYEVYLRL